VETIALGVGFGLVTGAILALAAVAFTLQYAVSNVLNLAFGEIMTCGAYAGYFAARAGHLAAPAGAAAALAGAAAAWALYAGVIEPFGRARVSPVVTFIGTLGAALVFQNVLLLAAGAASIAYAVPPEPAGRVGPFLWTTRDEGVMLAAAAASALLSAGLRWTAFGKSLRAVAENRALARLSGVDARRVARLTWLLSGALAGAAGFVLAATLGTLTPALGARFLLVTMAAAVVGGLGKPYGAMAAAMLLGIVMETGAMYVDAGYKLLAAFGLLVLVVLIRPNGLFAGADRGEAA
jgi:branched-subunit amino acid ABC-type transport system permease component